MKTASIAAALAAIVLASAPAGAQTAPQTVEVTMASYAFAPATLQFQKGMAYRLHLVNTSGKGHSFAGKAFFAAVDVAPEDKSKVADGDVEVDEGQAVDISFVAMTPGTYDFECSHFLHAGFGMKGTAVIQ